MSKNETPIMENANLSNEATTENAGQALSIKDDNGNVLIPSFKNRRTSFCSLDLTTPETKEANAKMYYNILNAPNENISDHINEEVVIKDIFAEDVTLDKKDDKGVIVCDDNGEVITERAVRVVLIDVNGVSYQSLSKGIYQSTQRLLDAFGVPTWEKGVKVKILRKQVNKGQMFFFQAV